MMTTPKVPSRTTEPGDMGRQSTGHGGHRGHGWMMIACCIPMIALAVILVSTGAVGPGFLLVALACTAMMALMMGGMHGGKSDEGPTGPAKRP